MPAPAVRRRQRAFLGDVSARIYLGPNRLLRARRPLKAGLLP